MELWKGHVIRRRPRAVLGAGPPVTRVAGRPPLVVADPIFVVSKLRLSLKAPDRHVISFLRRLPAAFVESVGAKHNHP